jgi:predicted Rdx family selenoprotein
VLAEIKSAVGVSADLIPGSAGIFEVKKDGVVIFSKNKLGRFLKEGEIAELLTKVQSPE